jgi:excisionase family DNA binding protein
VSETPNHNLLTVKETAEYLRIPLPTVYYLVQRGQIPAIQIGGRWRIKKSSLDRDILRQDKQGQPTVLVVDDDPELQELFKSFLKKIGFSRVVVGTAKDAIASLQKPKFDLMFFRFAVAGRTRRSSLENCQEHRSEPACHLERSDERRMAPHLHDHHRRTERVRPGDLYPDAGHPTGASRRLAIR